MRSRVDHRSLDARSLSQRDAVRQHRVRADARALCNAAVVAEISGAFHLVEIVELDTLAEPDVSAQANSRDVQAHVALERVEVRLSVLVEIPDVLPVALHRVAVDRPTHLEKEREELLREVVRAIRRHVTQDLRLEHVDARVDRVGEDLTPGRLLEEPLDASFLIRHDDAELEWVVDRLEADRHRGLSFSVKREERSEVHVAECIAGDHEERLVELPCRVAHRSGRAERRLFDGVADLHPERFAGAEVTTDRLREERNGDDHVRQAVLTQKLEDVLHARLADDWDHRLRLVRGQRAQTRALAARHDDCLHRLTSLHADDAYTAPAASASARPAQKIQYGQCVLRWVTIRKPTPA